MLVGLLKLLGLFPLWLLYGLSTFTYYILYYIIRYRKAVVKSNLKNAFPNKSENDLLKIQKEHYKYFCDLFFEAIAFKYWSKKKLLKHINFSNFEILKPYLENEKTCLLTLGHFGNWEWAGPCMDATSNADQIIIYKKISNTSFEKYINQSRGKFGAQLVEMKNTLRSIVSNKNNTFTMALNADQSPRKEGAYWSTFLNQETAFLTGPEKLAKKFDFPVFYTSIKRISRGKYSIDLSLITDTPTTCEENYISEVFVRSLEMDIQSMPAYWLWTHRRWKMKRS